MQDREERPRRLKAFIVKVKISYSKINYTSSHFCNSTISKILMVHILKYDLA